MSILNIVFLCVIILLVFVVLLNIIFSKIMNKMLAKKVVDFGVLDEFAPKNPIVFLGDSLTDFYPVSEFFPNLPVINRGVANEETTDIIKRLDNILELKPKQVFLQVGINDFLHKKTNKVEVLVKSIIEIALKLKTVCDNIVLISLYPINKKKTKISGIYLKNLNTAKIKSVNKSLEIECENLGLKYLNLYDKLVDDFGNLNSDYTIEGLHLNLQGYSKITPFIKQLLVE